MGFFGWYPSSLQPQPPPHWKTAFLIVLPRMAWPQVLAASQNIKFTNVDILTKFIIHMIGCYILTKYFFFFPLSVVVIFLYIFFFFDVTMNGTPRHYWRRSQKRKRKFVTTASLSNLGGRRTHQKRAQTIAKQQLWWCPSHKQNTLCGVVVVLVLEYSRSFVVSCFWSSTRASWDSFFFWQKLIEI